MTSTTPAPGNTGPRGESDPVAVAAGNLTADILRIIADADLRVTGQLESQLRHAAEIWIESAALGEADPALITGLAILLREANREAARAGDSGNEILTRARQAVCATLGITRLDTPQRDIEFRLRAALARRNTLAAEPDEPDYPGRFRR